MNCYKHNNLTAVATCSNSCGRGLCSQCADIYKMPLCDNCAIEINSNIKRQSTSVRIKILGKIIVNIAFFVPYIILFSQQNATPDWLAIPMIVWGFIAFRWLLNAFFNYTRISTYQKFKTWSITYFIGSLICAALGFLVIPFLIISEIIQFLRA